MGKVIDLKKTELEGWNDVFVLELGERDEPGIIAVIRDLLLVDDNNILEYVTEIQPPLTKEFKELLIKVTAVTEDKIIAFVPVLHSVVEITVWKEMLQERMRAII